MKNFFVVLILLATSILLIGVFTVSAEEEASADSITLATYYPSPYGVYDGLMAYRLGVGDNSGPLGVPDGQINNLDAPTTLGQVYLKGPVGINTTTLSSPLTVSGIIESTSGGFRFPDGTTQTTAGGGGDGGGGGWTDDGTIVRLTTNTDKVVLGTVPPLANNSLNIVGGLTIDDPSVSDVSMSGLQRVRAWGNLGIGTTSPQARLHVKGDIWTEAPTGNARRVSMSANTTFSVGEIQGWDATTNTPKDLILQGTGGNVGIKQHYSKMPQARLDIDAFGVRVDDMPNDTTPFVIDQFGNVGIGTSSPTSTLYVNGTFTATGAKNFELPHPTKKGYTLTHSTIEGPEAAVFYRGEAKLTNASAIVELPDYFEALTRKEHRTVQLTPKGKTPYLLSATDITDNTFQVFGTEKEGSFFWEVKAERKDVEPLRVEKNVQKEL